MLNIFLIPYTWLRHFAMALWCGVAGLLAWFAVLSLIVSGKVYWPPDADGPTLMVCVSAAVAMAAIAGEGSLRRLGPLGQLWRIALTGALSAFFTSIWYAFWHAMAGSLLFSGDQWAEDAADASLVSLTFRIGAFAMGGLGSGCAVLMLRIIDGVSGEALRRRAAKKRQESGLAPIPHIPRTNPSFLSHLAGGLAAGLAAGMCWHLLGSGYEYFSGDLYLAGAGMGLAWGFTFGLLTWTVPDELYAGWVRVLSDYRYGRRIPVDALDGSAKERFVGHFPRGLDLYLPAETAVSELHVSVAVDGKRQYKARGLTLQPTLVRRFLERINLRYDPQRPAPLETRLSSGDRIFLGEGDQQTELEFIMLPREER